MANEPAPTNNPPKDNHRFSPELPYESRYFSVFLTEGGTVISVNTGKNCGSGSTTAIEYAQTVTRIGSSKGFVDDYRYVSYISDNEIHLIFLDYGREMNSFRTFLFTSAGVSAGGLVAVMLLLIFLSGQSSSLFQKAMKSKNNLSPTPETPLTIIDADAEVLEMDIGENERLKDIQMQTKRLAQLTNSLILLSRMEEQPYIEKIEFPVSDLVEERQIPAKPGEPPALRNP